MTRHETPYTYDTPRVTFSIKQPVEVGRFVNHFDAERYPHLILADA